MKYTTFLCLVICVLSTNAAYIPHDEVIDNSLLDILRKEKPMRELVEKYNYPLEDYNVTTDDGYMLNIFRIPYGLEKPKITGRPAVFIQHGLLCSSSDWVVTGPENALAFILADYGYDVWLGNVRGNTYSKNHISLSPSSSDFWDFSWNEIGQHDLPAMIDFVISKTGQKKIHYIGHSQGTTSFFVMGSTRTDYNDKILSMHALAPVAFMSHLKSPFVRFFSPFVDQVEWIASAFGLNEFLPSNKLIQEAGGLLCHDESIFQEVCANVLFLIAGYNSPSLNRTHLPLILANTPAGASVRQLIHYGQGVNSAQFRMYDYGFIKNLLKYGSRHPPEYDLKKISAPVFLHYSDNDWLAAVPDVEELHTKLGNSMGKFHVADPKFNHLDYQWGMDAKSYVYDRVIKFMDRYN